MCYCFCFCSYCRSFCLVEIWSVIAEIFLFLYIVVVVAAVVVVDVAFGVVVVDPETYL